MKGHKSYHGGLYTKSVYNSHVTLERRGVPCIPRCHLLPGHLFLYTPPLEVCDSHLYPTCSDSQREEKAREKD